MNLKIEITESALMENVVLASDILSQLKNRQIHIAIDDFGTGYSSLSYLHCLPVDTLKIDKSFVRRLQRPFSPATLNRGQDQSAIIVQSTIRLAHDLGMDVVAEGIEEASQLNLLQALGCDLGQGYLCSKPLAADAASQFLLEHSMSKDYEFNSRHK